MKKSEEAGTLNASWLGAQDSSIHVDLCKKPYITLGDAKFKLLISNLQDLVFVAKGNVQHLVQRLVEVWFGNISGSASELRRSHGQHSKSRIPAPTSNDHGNISYI